MEKGDWKTVQKMFFEFNASEFGRYDPIENTDDTHVSILSKTWCTIM
ncbi:MAG: hypothetical protein SOH60_08060 [Lachnospiraceae bacterium]|jgi:hypothetical protein